MAILSNTITPPEVLGKLTAKLTTPAEALRQLIDEYRIKHDLDEVGDFSSTAFDKYTTDRVHHISQLKTCKTPGGDLISEKLSKATGETKTIADALTASLNTAFNTSEEFQKAKTDYEDACSHFQGYVASLPKSERTIEKLYGKLKGPIDSAITAIETQQKQEKTVLEAKLNASDEDLKTSLDVVNEQLDTVKSNIKKDLETLHKTQLDTFIKSTENSMRKLLDTVDKRMEERLFIARMHKSGSRDMLKLIEKIALENQSKAGEHIATSVTINPDGVDLSSINLKSLEFIQLLGGKKITNDKGEPPLYTLKMGWKIRSPLYYLFDWNKKDLLNLAQIVRASGSKTILMTPRSDNEKDARAAYEACIKSGFAPSDIYIEHPRGQKNYLTAEKTDKAKVKGKEVKTESIQSVLYKDHGSEFANLQKLSGTLRKELKEIKEFDPKSLPKDAHETENFKVFIANAKAKQQQAVKPPAGSTLVNPEIPAP